MLTPNLQSKFIEKILTDRDGRQFRVLFIVSLVEGEIRGQIVSAQPIGERIKNIESRIKSKNEILCLPCKKSDFAPILTSYFLLLTSFLSPYSSLDFFMSQPTRAPSK